MPNWIVNILNVYSDSEESSRELVEFLKQHLHKRDYDKEVVTFFDFNTVIPAPDKSLEYVPLNKRLNGPQPNIAWRRKNWNTKWNSDSNIHYDYESILNGATKISGEIQLVFRTAWNPPLPVIKELILMHPELNISCDYYSLESMIAGCIAKDFFDEEQIIHESWDLKNYNKEII